MIVFYVLEMKRTPACMWAALEANDELRAATKALEDPHPTTFIKCVRICWWARGGITILDVCGVAGCFEVAIAIEHLIHCHHVFHVWSGMGHRRPG